MICSICVEQVNNIVIGLPLPYLLLFLLAIFGTSANFATCFFIWKDWKSCFKGPLAVCTICSLIGFGFNYLMPFNKPAEISMLLLAADAIYAFLFLSASKRETNNGTMKFLPTYVHLLFLFPSLCLLLFLIHFCLKLM